MQLDVNEKEARMKAHFVLCDQKLYFYSYNTIVYTFETSFRVLLLRLTKQLFIDGLFYLRAGIGRIQKSEEICGELNPGFNLWTSAHGFHHAR